MSTWYYYNEQGEKIEVTGGQLKGLAKAGLITPETVVETEDGKTAPARKVKGLTFATVAPPIETESYGLAQPKPPSEPSPFTASMPATAKSADSPLSASIPEARRVTPESKTKTNPKQSVDRMFSDEMDKWIKKHRKFVLSFFGFGFIVIGWIFVSNSGGGSSSQPVRQPDRPVVVQQQKNAASKPPPQFTAQDKATLRRKIDFLIKEGIHTIQKWDERLTLTDKEKEAVVEYLILAERTFKRQYYESELRSLLKQLKRFKERKDGDDRVTASFLDANGKLVSFHEENMTAARFHTEFGDFAFARHENADIYIVCLADYVRGGSLESRELEFFESLFSVCNRLSGNAYDIVEKIRFDLKAKEKAEKAGREAKEAERRAVFGN
jgi:hypothetical protein